MAEGLPVTVISKLVGNSRVVVTSRYLHQQINGQAMAILESVGLPEPGPYRPTGESVGRLTIGRAVGQARPRTGRRH